VTLPAAWRTPAPRTATTICARPTSKLAWRCRPATVRRRSRAARCAPAYFASNSANVTKCPAGSRYEISVVP
jgi:hypothetical protein